LPERIRLNIFLHLITGVMALLILVIVTITALQVLRAQARSDAETLALALLYRNQATHRYFCEQLKPAVYELAGGELSEGYSDLSWMSSTYALIQIEQVYNELIGSSDLGAYEWKQATTNARDTANEADALERAWIEKMNADTSLERYSGVVEFDDERYIAVLVRGEVMEEECMPCHGDPADTPPDLLAQYGERGLNRQPGEMVSLASLRIPLAVVNQEARSLALQLSPLLMAAMVLLYLFSFMLTRWLLFRPLEAIGRKVESIAHHPDEVGDQLAPPFGYELKRLTDSLNAMSTNLAAERDQLQERADERTTEVHRQKKYFETLIENNPLAVAVVDREDHLLSCNPAFESLFGYVEEEVCGLKLIDLVVPEERRHQIKRQREKTLAGIPWNETTIRRRADGESVNVELHTVPLEIEGEESRFLVMYQDITKRLAAERVMAKSDKLGNIGTLAAGIAHELNSPLQVVTGLVDSLQRRINGEKITLEEVDADLVSVKRNAWRMADVVRSLSTYLHPSIGQLELCSLNQVVVDATRLVNGELKTNPAVVVNMDLSDDLPPMYCQRSYLVQATVNIIMNAREAMPEGGALTMTTRTDAKAQWISLKVCDTGKGISEESLSHIFDPFYTTKPAGSGIGMGLSVVDAIVRAHHGEIKVSSLPGEGACLELSFPYVDVDDVPPDSLGLHHGRYDEANNE
jgi:PAS domain S-box-containing protein